MLLIKPQAETTVRSGLPLIYGNTPKAWVAEQRRAIDPVRTRGASPWCAINCTRRLRSAPFCHRLQKVAPHTPYSMKIETEGETSWP
jgi:hypothetical protein